MKGEVSKALISSRKWRSKNKDKVREKNKEWCLNNPWHQAYRGAKQRCNNPNNAAYGIYGGRGIEMHLTMKQVEHLWNRDLAVNMKCPSIDRIDNNGNYELSNCRFIEKSENTRRKCIKTVVQRDMEGHVVAIFSSQVEAAKLTGLSRYGITKCYTGKQKSYAGFKWEALVGGVKWTLSH